jgi:hypothetical protein
MVYATEFRNVSNQGQAGEESQRSHVATDRRYACGASAEVSSQGQTMLRAHSMKKETSSASLLDGGYNAALPFDFL